MKPRLIHTADIGGLRVRFFTPPVPGPSFPWVVFRDLLMIGGCSAEAAPTYLSDLARDWKSDIRFHRHEGEDLLLAPNFTAIGYIRATKDCGSLGGFLLDRHYPDEGYAAFKATNAHLSPAGYQLHFLSCLQRDRAAAGEGGETLAEVH